MKKLLAILVAGTFAVSAFAAEATDTAMASGAAKSTTEAKPMAHEDGMMKSDASKSKHHAKKHHGHKHHKAEKKSASGM